MCQKLLLPERGLKRFGWVIVSDITPLTLNVFFDVDFTLIGLDATLRPGTESAFRRLVSDGHRIFVWSGHGIREGEIQSHGLNEYVTAFFIKPQEDFRASLARFGVGVLPDLVVDDDVRLVNAFGGVLVDPYYYPGRDDGGMDVVYEVVRGLAQDDAAGHELYRSPRWQH